MNTLDFFQTTLPEVGPYYGVLFHDKGKTHKSCDTLDDLAALVDKYKDDERVAVYHACASYQHPFVMVPHPRNPDEGKKAWRVPSNWGKAKSFWLDIDCGEEKHESGEGYIDKNAGNVALSLFCSKTGLPRPMLVDSGNGLHAYWPLTRAIGPKSWRKFASALKSLTEELGFLADPHRTSDLSSVLRPPGTFNRKGENAKSVVVRRKCAAIEPEEFAQLLRAAVDKYGVLAVKQYDNADVNADILAHVRESVPSSAVLAASKCQQLAQVKDKQGDVGYDQWFGAIGIIVHSTEGIELAREWSALRAETGHTTCDPDERFNTWNAGPTTCEKFNSANPGGCGGCEFSGKVKSPIMLGRVVPEQPAGEVAAEIDGEEVIVQLPALPKDYGFGKDGSTIRYLTDKDGIIHPFVFTPLTIYATHRVVNESGSYGLAIRAHLPRGRIREFTINTSTLEASNELAKALGDKEIVTTSHEKARFHLTAYLKDSLHKLMSEADEINTLTSFGWHYDMQAFLIGDRLFHRDGTVRKVLVGGYAASVIDRAFGKSHGTIEGYARALNDIYARPGMEPYQYVVASTFGSILTVLGEDTYNGLLLALTGKSGKGKSSVCQAALYAFGDAKEGMTITGDKRVGATENGRWGMLGAFRNIPLLFDETTKVESEDLSRMAYTVSLGKDKIRQTVSNGEVRMAAQHSWRMSPMATANNDIHLAFASMQSNSEAEAVRVVQIRTERYEIPTLGESEVPAAIEQMRRNRGVAGEAFIRHVVTNLHDVEQLWRDTMAEVTKAIPGSKFRFFRNHATCTLAALKIINELGITEFDYQLIFDFAVKLMQDLSEEVDANNVQTPREAFMRMVNELIPRIVITNEYRDGRDKAGPEDSQRVNGAIAGRYVTGNGSKQDAHAGHLYITKREFKAWCGENRVSPAELESFLDAQDVLLKVPPKFLFTRGTNLPMLQSPCIGVDMGKLNGVMVGGPKIVPSDDNGVEDAA